MIVDQQTLHDLGIFSPDGTRASVFDWLDFTRTQGGARLLKQMLREPLSGAGAIRETQEAVVWLGGNEEAFHRVIAGSLWLALERYTASAFAPLNHPNRVILWLDSWFLPWIHRDVYREVLAGIALAQTLVRSARTLLDGLPGEALPPLLQAWRSELDLCLATPELAALTKGPLAHRARPAWVLSRDRALRTVAFTPLLTMARLIHRMDALRSLAIATRVHDLVIPEIAESPAPLVEAIGLRHPLLEHATGNPLRITSDGRLIYLTGPNMSGKSTYLRSAGIAVLLAQLGMGVPATRFRWAPFGCLLSGIDTTDNLRLGQSYFHREVRRVREVADHVASGARCFVIFDEMFKGTNVKDASDATGAVLTAFSRARASAFLIASHLTEVAPSIARLPGGLLVYLDGEVREGEIRFSYRLASGVSEQRLGMLILEREGVLESLKGLSAGEPATEDAAQAPVPSTRL